MDTLHRRLADAMRPEIERGLGGLHRPSAFAALLDAALEAAFDGDVRPTAQMCPRKMWAAVRTPTRALYLALGEPPNLDGRASWYIEWCRDPARPTRVRPDEVMTTRGLGPAQLADALASLIVATMED